MRRPIQVLVLPYIHNKDNIEFAIFKRKDLNVWQGIAGGVEEKETILEACKREANEEAGIPLEKEYIRLSSKSTIPVNFINGNFQWGNDIFNVTEYCFGVCVDKISLTLSSEHTEMCWVNYETAFKLFEWDSNRNALWELNERIKRIKKTNKKIKVNVD